jgi:hypothetical protein
MNGMNLRVGSISPFISDVRAFRISIDIPHLRWAFNIKLNGAGFISDPMKPPCPPSQSLGVVIQLIEVSYGIWFSFIFLIRTIGNVFPEG